MGRRKYHIDHKYFSIIDTQAKAYWLGYFLADGYMFARDHALSISSKDEDTLIRFSNATNSTYPIKPCNVKYFIITWWSKPMYQDLISLGLCPRKSYGYKLPEVDSDLIPHFVRGILDGDGSIYYRKDRFGVRAEICGTPKLCSWVLNLIRKELNVGGGIHKRSDTLHYWILCGGKQVAKFREWLYAGAEVYLPRKRKLFYELEEHYKGGALCGF